MTNPLSSHVQVIPRPKGRKVPELPTFTFESTGEIVHIRRLGPFTMDEIRKSLLKERPLPKVPMVAVEVGEMRVKMQEPHPSDPNYIREVGEHQVWFNQQSGEKMMKLMVDYAIVCDDVDEDIVAEKRAMLGLIDPELAKAGTYSDKEIYVRHYLLASPKELQDVQSFILGQSMPTPEAVQEHIDTFQRDLQGEEPVRTPGTPIGLPV